MTRSNAGDTPAASAFSNAMVRPYRVRAVFNARRKGVQQVRGNFRISVHDGHGMGPGVHTAALKPRQRAIAFAAKRWIKTLENDGAAAPASAAVASVQLSATTRMRYREAAEGSRQSQRQQYQQHEQIEEDHQMRLQA